MSAREDRGAPLERRPVGFYRHRSPGVALTSAFIGVFTLLFALACSVADRFDLTAGPMSQISSQVHSGLVLASLVLILAAIFSFLIAAFSFYSYMRALFPIHGDSAWKDAWQLVRNWKNVAADVFEPVKDADQRVLYPGLRRVYLMGDRASLILALPPGRLPEGIDEYMQTGLSELRRRQNYPEVTYELKGTSGKDREVDVTVTFRDWSQEVRKWNAA